MQDEAFAEAVRDGKAPEVKRLLDEGMVSADAKGTDRFGNTESPALCKAAMNGHLDALKLLRRHGANLEATNSLGQTALIGIAAAFGKADCAEALLEWGADKDAADRDGRTALHWAARNGELECARLLVRARADRAKKDKQGKTALELAGELGNAEVAALLEQADANVSTPLPLRGVSF